MGAQMVSPESKISTSDERDFGDSRQIQYLWIGLHRKVNTKFATNVCCKKVKCAFLCVHFSSWSVPFKDRPIVSKCGKSVFPGVEFEEKIEQTKPNIEEFQIESYEKLNWLQFGMIIKKLYKCLSNIENGAALTEVFESDDFLLKEVQPQSVESASIPEEQPIDQAAADTEVKEQHDTENDNNVQTEEKQEYSNSENALKCAAENANSVDGSTEDSDAPTTGDDTKAASKPKSRRRGSDLKLLDPWFYWKNRKYSQRQKNKQMERMETDTTANGFLKKILEKYFE